MHCMDLARRRLTPDFTYFLFLVEACIASAGIYARTTFVFFCSLFLGDFLSSRVT